MNKEDILGNFIRQEKKNERKSVYKRFAVYFAVFPRVGNCAPSKVKVASPEFPGVQS